MKAAALILIVSAFALSLGFYSQLPDSMPVHWNAAGKPDGFAPKLSGAFLMPVVMIAIALLFAALPRLSPRGYEVDSRSRAFRGITLSLLAFLLAIHTVVLLWGTGIRLDFPRVVPILLGAMFAVMGNYLGKVRRNFFIGIRTPWTLADEDVWFRTHRFGGKLLVAGGIVSMIGGLVLGDRAMPLLIGVVIAAALVSVVYSYVIYQKSAGS